MRTSTRLLLIIALSSSTIAVANSRAEAQLAGMTTAPFQMPSVYAKNTFGAELMMGVVDPPVVDDFTIFALELAGTYKLSNQLYLSARMPIGHVTEDNTGTTLGNLTAGLEYRLSTNRQGRSINSWTLGGSVSLPTAGNSGDSFFASLAQGLFRLPYPGRYLPDTTAVRIHGQFRIDSRKIFFQSQLGLNHLIIDGGDDQPLLRIGMALGISVARSTTLIAEWTILSDLLEDSDGDNFNSNLDLGVRFRTSARTRIGLRLHLPLDDFYRDQDIFGLAIDVSSQF